MNEIYEIYKRNFPYISREEKTIKNINNNNNNIVIERRNDSNKLIACAIIILSKGSLCMNGKVVTIWQCSGFIGINSISYSLHFE